MEQWRATIIRMPEDLKRKLRKKAKEEGKPMAELVRDILLLYLGGEDV